MGGRVRRHGYAWGRVAEDVAGGHRVPGSRLRDYWVMVVARPLR